MSQGSQRKGGDPGGGTGDWAGGRPRSPGGSARPPRDTGSPDAASSGPVSTRASAELATRLRATLDLASAAAAIWAPVVARILLGLVLLWFGYHELVLPGEWTGYVPVISESSSLAVILVLAHGWVLLVLAAALVAGIVPRTAAAIASLLLLEIVISLAVSGLSDTVLRDLGVLGLALCLTGCKNQRLVLRT
jgi:uncharacterized membrane protein YphA (DoxX/SURF4 family)